MAPVTSHPPESLQRLLDEAPFVRLLARTLLAEEADEVVQQTWLHAVRHGGEGVAEPRSWLARIAFNVAQNLRRRRDRRRRHESGTAAPDLAPSSAELMAREEHRAMLVAAVDRLPATLRTVVLLRYFDGLPPRRIAADLGVPVTTVWNRLRQGLQLLRERLDAEHGGQRRAWLLPLVPFAAGPHGLPWVGPALPASTFSTLGLGVIVMTMKTKLVAAVAVLLAVSGALVLWAARDAVPGRGSPPDRIAEQSSAASSDVPRDAVAAAAKAGEAAQREAVTSVPADGTGTLVVHVRWGDDKTPAEGLTMIVCRSDGSPLWDGLRQTTGADGTARFESLAAGRFSVKSDRGWVIERALIRAEIRGGETTELDYELEVGMTLIGIVVDAVGTPVPGAVVEVAQPGFVDSDAVVLATAGLDGRFVVRGAPTQASVRARAPGHCSTLLQHIIGKDGNTAEVRLQLGRAAGAVAGMVVDSLNLAVPGAVVCIGRGISPVPTLVRTDAEGRFTAFGIEPGSHPVFARARDKAPWRGTCEVTAHLTAPLQIVLNDGATLRGVVRDADGAAVAKVDVEVGTYPDFAYYRATSNEDGGFELTGLPAGVLKLRAKHDSAGRAEQSVQTAAGAITPCNLQLSRGTVLAGRVVDEQGKPVVGAVFMVRAPRLPGQWNQDGRTDPDGRFEAPSCPAGEHLEVTVARTGFAELVIADVDPTVGPLVVTLRRLPPASVKVTGILADPAGLPMPNVRVEALGPARTRACVSITGPDGRFELGPLPPGTWTFRAISQRFPPWSSGAIPLAADANLDLGLVSMAAGGTAIVHVEGDRADAQFLIMDATASPSGLTEKGGALVSKTLAPGDYRLRVTGKAVAAESIPFQVRTGEETPVIVKLRPGVRQRFEVVANGAALPQDAVLLIVHRGTDLLTQTGLPVRTGEPAIGEACLSPGDYRVVVATAERELLTATFTVGATEGPPLRLELH